MCLGSWCPGGIAGVGDVSHLSPLVEHPFPPFQKGRRGSRSSVAEKGRRGWDGEQAPRTYALDLHLGFGLQFSWTQSPFAHHLARPQCSRMGREAREGVLFEAWLSGEQSSR